MSRQKQVATPPPPPLPPREYFERDLWWWVKDVAEDCRVIAGRLALKAEHLEKRLAERNVRMLDVNSLGELQSSTTVLDAKFAQIATLRKVLEYMDNNKE